VNEAVEAVLNSGRVTADLRPSGPPATTSEVGDAVCAAMRAQMSAISDQLSATPEQRAHS
jgi:hypothetical protein